MYVVLFRYTHIFVALANIITAKIGLLQEKNLRKSQEKIVLTALNYSLHLLLSSSKEALFKNFLGTTTC